MAQYRCSIKIGGRKDGKGKAIAKLAYINASEYKDEAQDRICSYTEKENVVFTDTLITDNAPLEYKDPATLWNIVQKFEKHPKAQYYREFEINLPVELDIQTNMELAKEMARTLVADGMCVSMAVHDNPGNPHVHFMCTMRSIGKNGKWQDKKKTVYVDKDGNPTTYKKAARDKKGKPKYITVPLTNWSSKEKIFEWRKRWEVMINKTLEREGFDERVSCETLEKQGIDRIPGIHLGPVASRINKRGQKSWRVEKNNEIKKINERYEQAVAQKKALADELLATEHEIAVVERDIASIEAQMRDKALADEQAALIARNDKNVVYGEGFKKQNTQISARTERAVRLLYSFLNNEVISINKQYNGVNDSDLRRIRKQSEDIAISEYHSKRQAENRKKIKDYSEAKEALSDFKATEDYKKIVEFEAKKEPSKYNIFKYRSWLKEKDEVEPLQKHYKELKISFNNAEHKYNNMSSLSDRDILMFDSVKKSADEHFNKLFNSHSSSLIGKASALKAPVEKAMDTITGLFDNISYNVGQTEKDEQLAVFDFKDIFFPSDENKSQDLQDLKEITGIISKVLPTGSTLFDKFKGAIADYCRLANTQENAPINPDHRPKQPPPPRSR